MTFQKNAWYVAAMASEIDDKPLGRRICGLPLAFFRGEGGQVAAVEDWCPHRGAPMSLGKVVDGKLVCGYHGLAMGCNGKAHSMPGQRVGGFPANRSYPVVERHGFIWLWPGDPDKADPALIHQPVWSGNADWAYGGGLYHIKCDYRLMVDNLMDLTHETYVHSTSIGQAEIDESPCRTRTEGDEVITSRFMENIIAPPFWQMALRANGLPDDQPVDRWQICHFTPPSHVMIEVGVALAGHGGHEAPTDKKASSLVVDFITPETETSIWYFWGMARDFRPGDAALTDSIREGQGKIFSEDLEMLERQQQNLLEWPGRNLLKLNIDTGGVQARRVIDRMIAADSAGEAEVTSA
ncbi:aromatic ring-hydroxylating oxygenase subunit alpha [Denitromonas iodatirespirans]|uniref:Aromatic ring-hydroxylating dioxygenase subunit alpha n=1 Tax=Denitromonas iodatirespirans TaxID=2795389 RepID=A0A944DAG3_DENI1|nr:aromatic ring-hydroxylating dioxygenase subunit alpha [Denitromonas iodatirespirans]MBT0962954.1 aromatic ring-hydroxylating dioxygenase subunit alpha [Denitromonas iodatirespirans]